MWLNPQGIAKVSIMSSSPPASSQARGYQPIMAIPQLSARVGDAVSPCRGGAIAMKGYLRLCHCWGGRKLFHTYMGTTLVLQRVLGACDPLCGPRGSKMLKMWLRPTSGFVTPFGGSLLLPINIKKPFCPWQQLNHRGLVATDASVPPFKGAVTPQFGNLWTIRLDGDVKTGAQVHAGRDWWMGWCLTVILSSLFCTVWQGIWEKLSFLGLLHL